MLIASAATVLAASPALAQSGQPDSVVYLLSPASQLEVQTGTTGFFSFVGHAHLIRARSPSGRVVFFPGRPSDSRVEITVLTDSLEVLTPPDIAERRKVTEAMRRDVLRVDRYDRITFVSTLVRPIPDGFRVAGRLTILDQTRDVTVDLAATAGSDTLRAGGTFSIRQTDFGVKPYHGGPGGLVKVADRLEFRVRAIAVRERGGLR
jgi:polyisoprenoid-binding protein YceI